ncbi:hypothetical protein KO507_17190 [Gilvimarinus agarilyticus]|uniref:hypothetical protein n=1 Tax=Gilvimarinus sp. 2_MG-2023 TaxID=3062666 RepID=UPI001C080358|nr:hypothetical protein [Gilvimarinus sp. 2_MG-2023]MBU2887503.1 hypothetical protein [Gilvimarinus agarilyticus]MDO6572154.1 hypothetical protein [Gilvimarinus sp. 2_MG-2023]
MFIQIHLAYHHMLRTSHERTYSTGNKLETGDSCKEVKIGMACLALKLNSGEQERIALLATGADIKKGLTNVKPKAHVTKKEVLFYNDIV